MAFRTKLDFSSNRQVKQHEKTTTVLSGGTEFGLTYSAMTNGPDLTTSAITESFITITGTTSTFSGNNTTSNYNWFDSRMVLGESVLSAITSVTSATTQNTGNIYTPNTTTIIDGNTVNLTYSGVSFNVVPTTVIDLGGGDYSGTVTTYRLEILSASTLDFTGRTIWNDVHGISRTQKLIISDNPQVGYVWTCLDSEGMGEWQYNGSSSASTIWTAGTGIGSAVLADSNGIASGLTSVSEGKLTIAGGDYSHAEGVQTRAFGDGAHSEGKGSIASGKNSHAEGSFTQATNEGSHAEGGDTISSGVSAHAEGNNTTASGDNSHSEGNFTQAIGNESHAGGSTTIASGQTSFVHGFNSVAGGNTTIVLGSNITGTTDNTTYVSNLIVNSGGTLSKLGINIEPQYVVDVLGNTSRLYYEPSVLGGYLTLSGNTNIPRISILVPASGSKPSAGGSIGFRCWDDVTYNGYGKVGDMFIYSSTESNGLSIISSDGTNTEDYIRFYVGGDASASSALAMHIHGTGATKGYVAINNTAPTERLDVNGNGRFRSIGSSASAGALHYTADGTLTTNTSDRRLKTNILSLTNALDKVKQLRGVVYNWSENPTGDTRIGFIAQEVNDVVPELTFVNPNSSENYMGVHYDNVTALLVEAVKELSSGVTISKNTYLETQTILAEDNNIELNYSGSVESAVGGGIRVLHAMGQDNTSELITDENGDFTTNTDFKAKALTIPIYTPTSSEDINGNIGNVTRDEDYLYIKGIDGWKRTNLERF